MLIKQKLVWHKTLHKYQQNQFLFAQHLPSLGRSQRFVESVENHWSRWKIVLVKILVSGKTDTSIISPIRGYTIQSAVTETVCGCACVTAVFLWVTLSRRSDPHTWSLSLYILSHSPSIPSLLSRCVSLSLSLPCFLCFVSRLRLASHIPLGIWSPYPV